MSSVLRECCQKNQEIRTGLPSKRCLKSSEIFQGQREVFIHHDHQDYRLLITKSGKLILNK